MPNGFKFIFELEAVPCDTQRAYRSLSMKTPIRAFSISVPTVIMHFRVGASMPLASPDYSALVSIRFVLGEKNCERIHERMSARPLLGDNW